MDTPRDAAEIVWLGEPDCLDPATVGPKAAHLSALATNHPVPAGFCLTAAAYRAARRAGGPTQGLRAAVRSAYERLVQGRDPDDVYVAVRSSALDEDGAEASFAGQHDTHLNVTGAEAVLAAIEATWASLHADAALAYRRSQGIPEDDMALAVLVQRMVWADAAGVAFSLDPVSGDRERIVISANWGLGESVAAGAVSVDSWQLDKRDLRTLSEQLGDKERMLIPSERGTREVRVPSFLRDRASLDEAERARVAELTRSLERERGWPVDIEFAWRGGELALLQCRPVTAVGPSA